MKGASILLSILITLNLSAQENKVTRVLNDIKSQLTQSKAIPADEEVLFKPGNEIYTLVGVKAWYTDTVKAVRTEAVSITARTGLKTQEPGVKQEAVKMLTGACADKDIAISGMAINYLTHFNRRDFVKDICDSVGILLKKQLPQFEKLARLAGFLDLKDQQQFLTNMLNDKSLSTKLQWSINLSLARMGNSSSIRTCLLLSKDYPVDDNIIYYILPDLVYTRQKVVFEYLLEILNSNKRSCTSPNPNYSGNILCGYRVMEALAGVVKNFPLKTHKSGDIETDDYDKALQITREWFKNNPNYELDMDIY
jgi:hypothetical protein